MIVAAFGATVGGVYYVLFGRTTPSHVFQISENIILELNGYQKAAKVTSLPVAYVPNNRKPRHVMQKAREILTRVENLKESQGIAKGEFPVFPTRKVTPKHVREIVLRILDEVQTLRPKYEITTPPPEALLVKGKVPTDVYGNLALIGNMLESLGVRAIQPKDVYRIVLTLIRDLRLVASTLNKPCIVRSVEVVPGKTHADVYRRTHRMAGRIIGLAKAMNVDAYFELSVPQRKTGNIEPSDVLDLINNVLADVGAMKAILAEMRATVVAPEQSSKAPSNVYAAVGSADAIVQCILK